MIRLFAGLIFKITAALAVFIRVYWQFGLSGITVAPGRYDISKLHHKCDGFTLIDFNAIVQELDLLLSLEYFGVK